MKTTPPLKAIKSRLDGLVDREGGFAAASAPVQLREQTLKQQGFDLIQIAIVVGVIGILMAGAFLGVPAVMAGVRANSDGQDLHSYMVAQQAMVEQGVISNETVIKSKLYNPEQVKAPGTITNRFGGSVTIAAPEADPQIKITSKGVPARACEKLVPVVAGLFDKITVGTVVVKDIAAQGADKQTALTRQKLSEACNKGGPQDIEYVGTR